METTAPVHPGTEPARGRAIGEPLSTIAERSSLGLRSPPAARRWARRSTIAGAIGMVALMTFYAVVVGAASRSLDHLFDQAAKDWYFLVPLMLGFGTQVGLMSELRRRQRLNAATTTAGVAGASASTAGMVACCAHHIVDLAPFLGASAAATFLTAYKVPFILAGLAVNGLGITLGLRAMRKLHVSGHASST